MPEAPQIQSDAIAAAGVQNHADSQLAWKAAHLEHPGNTAQAESRRTLFVIGFREGLDHGRLEAAQGQLASLREKLERAQKDTARLDWLEAHPFMAYRDRDPESGHLDDHFTLVDENKGRRDGRRGIVKATLREAIDEAKGAA